MSRISVYVMERPDGAAKIGISNNVRRRAGYLMSQTQQDISVSWSRQFNGRIKAKAIERTAHNLLRDRGLGGEWFAADVVRAADAVTRAAEMVTSGDLSFSKNPRIYPYRGAYFEARDAALARGTGAEEFEQIWLHMCSLLDKIEDAAILQRTEPGRMASEHARTKLGVKVGRLPALTDAQKVEAKRMWHDRRFKRADVANAFDVAPSTLFNYFGERFPETPTPPRRKRSVKK